MKYYSHFASFNGDSVKLELPDYKKRLLQSFIYKDEFYFRTGGYPDYQNTSLNKSLNVDPSVKLMVSSGVTLKISK
jgi:hypothetical protein